MMQVGGMTNRPGGEGWYMEQLIEICETRGRHCPFKQAPSNRCCMVPAADVAPL